MYAGFTKNMLPASKQHSTVYCETTFLKHSFAPIIKRDSIKQKGFMTNAQDSKFKSYFWQMG